VRVCPSCGRADVDGDWAGSACGWEPARIDGFTAFAPELAREHSGFRPDFFARLAALEARSFWFRGRNELILWALKRYAGEVSSFLEIGCGTGFVLSAVGAAYPNARLSGSEVLVAGLESAARRLPAATLYQMDALRIPFRDEFDVIGAFDVIEHIADDEAVLAQIAAALRPGGSFLATVPQHPRLWSRQDEHARHVRRYRAGQLRRRVQDAGLEIVRMTSFVSLLLPFLVVSRLRMGTRPAAAAFDPLDEVATPALFNALFSPVMALERALIRRGVSFPAGGSLLLVGRKPPATRTGDPALGR
jgi:SAM-dependent methyltransferase